MGELIGLVAIAGFFVAGFRRLPFLKLIVPLSLGLFIVGWAVFRADAWLTLAGALAMLLWYGLGRATHWIWDRLTGRSPGVA
jgi:hypothetical protein